MTHASRILALLALLLAGCGAEGLRGPTGSVVKRVIDGDTIELLSGERVRYLMLDAPEITGGHEACYGAEARDFNRMLVDNRTVELGYDTHPSDSFGRLLAYVFIDGVEVNTLLVERGYACVLHIPPNGADRREEFEALEQQARDQGRGLWGYCESKPCR